MNKIGLYEAKTKLSALVAEIEASGEKVLLTRHGKVVAELSPVSVMNAPTRGALKSAKFSISENFDTTEVGFEDFFAEKAEVSLVAEEQECYDNK